MAREQEQQPISNINRICQGTEVVGNINTPGDIRLDGSLDGNITAKGKVVVGNTGRTKGEIVGRTTDIFGQVEGTLNISEIISLKSTSNVKGSIVTAKISIEAGAIFNGTCTMSETKVIPPKK
ncbi:MAG: polymer-forming cytoskeletal protein [Prevotellaceae bacterium]|jgi:cytoskeletal protein CcmA (bactofilin family)|nr:polymer-forming cytoskeletal protein [Prevotellaceae bacterium]